MYAGVYFGCADDTTYAVPHINAFKPAAAWYFLLFVYAFALLGKSIHDRILPLYR